ncbi:spore protease YyaC [Clostridium sp. 19966]|uniref:spore protease YyaC n=1 Tax=Clostridium sp. 19966 TaxID=2768166 RepID=UPI0028DFA077|nr:spore protease YyaC [Clostridium sp. 19966]MDT8719312.1 spore protease YyaC [Clostridium sp. 19966]
MDNKYVLNCLDINASYTLSNILFKYILDALEQQKQLVFLCIGTDRSTGDSLGPLIGDKLKFLKGNNISVFGNLESPVHAKNLIDVLALIKDKYSDPFIIAVDACLGSINNVGNIIIEKKPLNPGSAMNKKLPPVGDISITGIVNICGSLEFMVLQNTRLFTVMQLANVISHAIYHSILKVKSIDKISSLSNITSKV